MERDRRRHLQREEHEPEELRDAVTLRNIRVLRRRIRVLPETPERYVTYVHSLISIIRSFIDEPWFFVLAGGNYLLADFSVLHG